MKLFSLSLVSVIVVGVSAFAMPQVDGTYTCTDLKDNTQTIATLKTKDNRLYLSGTGVETANGFACDNSSTSQTMAGETVRVSAVCTDTQLVNASTIEQASTNTSLTTTVVVMRKSDSEVAVGVSFSGKTAGQSVDNRESFDCRK